tara:strand:- start:511 stop:825 length:315 start_codon:yes stop_codon:yes gene_type:complete
MRICHTDISVAIDYSPAFLCTWNNNKDVEVHSLESLLKKCEGGTYFDEPAELDGWWTLLDEFKKRHTFQEVIDFISKTDKNGGFNAGLYFRDSILSCVVLQRIK